MLKLAQSLGLLQGKQVSLPTLVLIATFVKVMFVSSLIQLGLFLMTLISFHWEQYRKQKQSENQSEKFSILSQKIIELESKVSSLSLATAFKGVNNYGTH